MSAIEVNGISMTYAGDVKALQNVSLKVEQGEIFGLLGPDGAGKTSLFRILTTLILPDSGYARVVGHDVVTDYTAVRAKSGYMPERFSLYGDLTIEENLNFFASLFGGKIEDNLEMIEPIYKQIEPFRKRRAAKLSGGMKQKLALCCALIHKPEVLFLDEPTTGVDAVSRSEFWDMLSEIKKTGLPILVSTPYMDEASRCDRIALMSAGRILANGTLNEILSRYRVPMLKVTGQDPYETLKKVRELPEISRALLFGSEVHAFPREISRISIPGCTVEEATPGIEDIFITLNDGEQTDN